MPLYEYLCDACGHRFEVIQKFSDARVEACPKCGGAVQKQVSSPAFQFKGSGWYVTDYAKKSGSAGGKSESSASSESKDSSSASESGSKDSGSKDSSTTAAPAAPAAKPS
jgi:putative FmdB family regulatory protein